MPFSSGTFSRVHNWATDKINSVKITASRMDAEFDGIATGLSACLLKDGTQTVTAHIPMAGFKITGLGAATAGGDAMSQTAGDARYLLASITSHTFANSSGLKIYDTGSDHTLGFIVGENLSANRTLTVSVSNANRAVTVGGDLSFGGALTTAGAVTTAGAFVTAGAYSLTLTATDTTNVTLPTTGTLATLAGAEALTNKTLTAAKIANGGFLADANGNELFIFTTTGSAVNEITMANAATGNSPTLTASGGDTNIHLTLGGKGTGNVKANTAFVEKVVTLSDGATVALDLSLGNVFDLTAAGNRTILAATNGVDGQKVIIRHRASGGARTLSLTTGSSGAFRYGTDVTGLTETTSGKVDYIGGVYNGADSRIDVVAYVKGY